MSFRARVLLAMLPLTMLPIALFAWQIRDRLDRRLAEQSESSIDAAAAAVRAELDDVAAGIGATLDALRDELVVENTFRLAVVEGRPAERRDLLDLAPRAMTQAGLDVLRIQDADGLILSSGHFRNEFDRTDAVIARAAAAAGSRPFVSTVATPGGETTALLRAVGFQVREHSITIVGGVEIDDAFLAALSRDPYVHVVLARPDRRPTTRAADAAERYAGAADDARAYTVPYAPGGSARFVIQASTPPIEALRRDIDTWFFGTLAAASLLALLLASWAAARVTRPLAELARRTSSIDLNRLDIDFETDRSDEVGSLSRMLGALQRRLRASSARLREAERRAAVGEIARQVNHDVRNGLTPIRNVVAHLSELARDRPEQLPAVFLERQRTLDASIEYLHGLAANYARLSPRLERRPCDVNAIVRDVTRGAGETDRARVRERLAPRLPPVLADPVALRRVIENIVTNAVESLFETGGTVTVTTGVTSGTEPRVRIVVGDTGRGMSRTEVARVFDHFYTTKENGTGLGLSIVRRMIGDLGGTVRLESEPEQGTRVIIDLPAADAEPPATEDVAQRTGSGRHGFAAHHDGRAAPAGGLDSSAEERDPDATAHGNESAQR